MTPAELRVTMGWLGVRSDDLGALLHVSGRTVRHWRAGRYAIPAAVGGELEEILAETDTAVRALVAQLADDPDVTAYSTDAAFWEAQPDRQPLPATWWDQVIARARAEVPRLAIVEA